MSKTSSTACGERMRRLLPYFVGAGLILTLAVGYFLAAGRMPVLSATDVQGIRELRSKLGQPSREYRQTAELLVRDGVRDVRIPADSLRASGERPLLVLIWERRTWPWRTARFVAIADPETGRVLHYGNGGNSFDQVLVMGDRR